MSDFFLFPFRPRLYRLVAVLGAVALISACNSDKKANAPTGLPYFSNLQPDEAWGRRGPSYDQPVLWEYRRSGLPVLVVDEILHWRQIKDHDGDLVWMRDFLLSSRDTVMVIAKEPIALYRSAGEDQNVVAYADPYALLSLGECAGQRCQLRKGNIRGWANRNALWGVDIPPE